MVERPIKKSDRPNPPITSETTDTSAIDNSHDNAREKSGDRPIKKSDRPAKSLDDSGESSSTPNRDRGKGRDNESKDRDRDSRGRDKKFSREEQPASNLSLALRRGPRPTKPKPPIVEEPLPEVTDGADVDTAPETE